MRHSSSGCNSYLKPCISSAKAENRQVSYFLTETTWIWIGKKVLPESVFYLWKHQSVTFLFFSASKLHQCRFYSNRQKCFRMHHKWQYNGTRQQPNMQNNSCCRYFWINAWSSTARCRCLVQEWPAAAPLYSFQDPKNLISFSVRLCSSCFKLLCSLFWWPCPALLCSWFPGDPEPSL